MFCKESQNETNIIFCTISATEYVGMYLFVHLLCPMLLIAYDCLPRRKIMVLPAYVGALDRKRQRETALITGASSGIGLDLAQLMAPDFDLIITARNQAELEKIAKELQMAHGNHVHVIPADLAQPEAPQQIFAEIERRGLPVDILINNAGFGSYGAFAESDPRTSLDMIEVNIAALTALTRLTLPGKDSGITVTCLCPGATATKFAGRANMEESRLFKLGAMKSRDVAIAGYKGMMAGKALVIPGVLNKTVAMSVRFSPRKLVTAISRSLQEKAK